MVKLRMSLPPDDYLTSAGVLTLTSDYLPFYSPSPKATELMTQALGRAEYWIPKYLLTNILRIKIIQNLDFCHNFDL